MRFFRTKERPPYWLATTLEKTPYLPPEIEETKETILRKLDVAFHVDKVQFGTYFREKYPGGRSFSVEWQKQDVAWLKFEYDHKLIQIKVEQPLKSIS